MAGLVSGECEGPYEQDSGLGEIVRQVFEMEIARGGAGFGSIAEAGGLDRFVAG